MATSERVFRNDMGGEITSFKRLDAKDEERVDAAAAQRRHDAGSRGLTVEQLDALEKDGDPDAPANAEAAQKAMQKRKRDAWKTPKGARK